MSIGAVHKSLIRKIRQVWGHDMRHLAARMHPGIGASGTHHGHRFTDHQPQGFLELLLHGDRIRLALPTGVLGAAIGNSQTVDHRVPKILARAYGTQQTTKIHGISGIVVNCAT